MCAIATCLFLAFLLIATTTQAQVDTAPEYTPYEPSFLRPATAVTQAAATDYEQERRALEEHHAKLSAHQRVCFLLLQEFSARASLDHSTQVAAELLLDYHKAGVSCFDQAPSGSN